MFYNFILQTSSNVNIWYRFQFEAKSIKTKIIKSLIKNAVHSNVWNFINKK